MSLKKERENKISNLKLSIHKPEWIKNENDWQEFCTILQVELEAEKMKSINFYNLMKKYNLEIPSELACEDIEYCKEIEKAQTYVIGYP